MSLEGGNWNNDCASGKAYSAFERLDHFLQCKLCSGGCNYARGGSVKLLLMHRYGRVMLTNTRRPLEKAKEDLGSAEVIWHINATWRVMCSCKAIRWFHKNGERDSLSITIIIDHFI